MSAWNDTHYARAEEFLRTIADAIPAPRPGHAAPEPAPAPAAPAASAPVAPAAPTAASVFKKMPWKK